MSNSLERTINAKHCLTVYCGLLTKARNCLPKYFDGLYEVYVFYKYLVISRYILKHFPNFTNVISIVVSRYGTNEILEMLHITCT